MPRKASVTPTEAFAAIHALLAAGEYPTFARLRVALRERGSPVLLQGYLADWYAEHGPKLAANADAAPATSAHKLGLKGQLAEFTKAAIAEFEHEKRGVLEALAAREIVVESMEKTADSRERQLNERDDAMQGHLADLRSKLEKEEQARVRAEQDASAARKAEAQALADMAALTKDIDAIREQLRQAQQAAEPVPELHAHLNEARQRIAALEAEARSAQERGATLAGELAEARGTLGSSREALTTLEARHALMTASMETAGEALDAARTAQVENGAALQAAVQRERALQSVVDDERLARADVEQRLAVAVVGRDLLQSSMDAILRDRAELGRQLDAQRQLIDQRAERIERMISSRSQKE